MVRELTEAEGARGDVFCHLELTNYSLQKICKNKSTLQSYYHICLHVFAYTHIPVSSHTHIYTLICN